MKNIIMIAEGFLIAYIANLYSLGIIFDKKGYNGAINAAAVFLAILLAFLIFALNGKRIKDKKLLKCGNGCDLLIMFLVSASSCFVYSLFGYFGALVLPSVTENFGLWAANTAILLLVENIVFWSGITLVYLYSSQLGVKIRVLGVLCGMIPIANLIMLGKIISVTSKEVKFENNKIILNESRKDRQICKTKYPILMVHGVFFRDFRYFNYWGRVPKELEDNGATIFYGSQQSAASVANCAEELKAKIDEVIEKTGAEKLNIIAHSKGGLDSRYAISMLGAADKVASLTTINTPHRGCEFADYLLEKIGKREQNAIASAYNAALAKLGDKDPDFIAAVTDLTASKCRERNEIVKDAEGVYYQSIGSKLNHAESGRFPLNFSYHLVKSFDGANDGLVGEKSFEWGESFRMLTVKGKRGISHGDMIDLNRENIDDFDIREFYVGLVSDLREKGF